MPITISVLISLDLFDGPKPQKLIKLQKYKILTFEKLERANNKTPPLNSSCPIIALETLTRHDRPVKL